MGLMNYLPQGMYEDNATMTELQTILDDYIEQLSAGLVTTVNNCFIPSAVELLSRYETIFGLPTNNLLSNQARADRIMTRLRGASVCTIDVLKAAVNAYFRDADVSEDNANYFFSLTFNGDFTNSGDKLINLKAHIDEIKPAHLDYDMRFQNQQLAGQYLSITSAAVMHYTMTEEDS